MQRLEEMRPDPMFQRLTEERLQATSPLREIEIRPLNRRREIVESAGHIPSQIIDLIINTFKILVIICLMLSIATKPIIAFEFAMSVLGILILSVLFRKILQIIALNNYSKELCKLEQLAKNALQRRNEIEEDYDNRIREHCDTFPSYPSDWSERRKLILARDSCTCTACGWSRETQGNSRELHVHHIAPLSSGGFNLLSNLTTLCHICHQNIDSKHAGVRRLNKPTNHNRRR